MDTFLETIEAYGGDPASVLAFEQEGPELLPYATLLSARRAGCREFSRLVGVYEWQSRPLLLLIDGEGLGDENADVTVLRRAAGMRGDAPYLGVVHPGRLTVYHIGLDNRRAATVRVEMPLEHDADKASFIPYLGNTRPAAARRANWIGDVVLRLLSLCIDALVEQFEFTGEDAISLVGRALFVRFLADRSLLGPDTLPAGYSDPTILFDSIDAISATVAWLDKTFNGDFLPLSSTAFTRLTEGAMRRLGDILRRAEGGQLHLEWSESWNRLDFAQIPVGVLSQAYERYQRKHRPKPQRQEGAFYTPRHIADLMVRAAFRELDRDGPAYRARVLDPAAGAGMFLITAFRQLVTERWRRDGRRPNTEVLRSILYNQITGFDIRESALRFAALGLYLISIELDPDPKPIEKLGFNDLRGKVLHKFTGAEPVSCDQLMGQAGELGSLGPDVGDEHVGAYDLVIGNPPWAASTGLRNWNWLREKVDRIARERLKENTISVPIPNEVLDLPFVWRALEWAKPGGQIAFALHARFLFQQGARMPEARAALLSALDATGVINGAELRHTKVWPEIAAPFCVLFARNQRPNRGSGFRFVTPRFEQRLNSSGSWRIDASNAETVAWTEVLERPTLLKTLFRGTRLDAEIYERIEKNRWATLEHYWTAKFGQRTKHRPRCSGNGYQKLRASSERSPDGLPGTPAEYLHGIPELVGNNAEQILIDTLGLRPFVVPRIHRRRPREIFLAPLLLVKKSPPSTRQRVRVSVVTGDLIYNETYYGYSASEHPDGMLLTCYLALVLGSRLAIWLVLVTSGEFGFEREVIEKINIDSIPIPEFERLGTAERAQIERLFAILVERDDDRSWAKIDAWVYSLYGLADRDIGVVEDTLAYNSPYMESRKRAQTPPTAAQREGFRTHLSAELAAWSARFRRDLTVGSAPCGPLAPWQFVAVGGRQGEVIPDPYREGLIQAADDLAATEIVIADENADRLWIGRLNQARYWTESQARLVARRIIWEHVDFLAGARR